MLLQIWIQDSRLLYYLIREIIYIYKKRRKKEDVSTVT